MSRGNEPAYPVPDVADHERNFYSYGGPGLTKREHFAGLAMQGLLASAQPIAIKEVVKDSIRAADALLAELDKQP